MEDISAAEAYLDQAANILNRVRASQMEHLNRAADLCTEAIAQRGLVHLFGTGHSRMMIEEMFPRHGSFPGFHPIVELSLTYHNPVVGVNGQRQAMFLEHVEGLAGVILRNFYIAPPDCFMIFSNSGVNQVVVDMGLEVKKRGLPLIVVVSVEHSQASRPQHSTGVRLIDIADVVIDTCTPAGDAMVRVPGLDDPVGPGSTIGGAAVVNAMKCLIAKKLTTRGQPPIVLTSAYFIGEERSAQQFERCYDDYRDRVRRVFGCGVNPNE